LAAIAAAIGGYLVLRGDDGSNRTPGSIGSWDRVSERDLLPEVENSEHSVFAEYQRPGESTPSMRVSLIGRAEQSAPGGLTDDLLRKLFDSGTRQSGVYLEPSEAVDSVGLGGSLRCMRHQGYGTDFPGPVRECIASDEHFISAAITFTGREASAPVDPAGIAAVRRALIEANNG
jgi:hypothetical protein